MLSWDLLPVTEGRVIKERNLANAGVGLLPVTIRKSNKERNCTNSELRILNFFYKEE
jgi:hypothetical protein